MQMQPQDPSLDTVSEFCYQTVFFGCKTGYVFDHQDWRASKTYWVIMRETFLV